MNSYQKFAMLLERKSARLFHVTQTKDTFESILDSMSLRSSSSEYSRLSMKAKNKGKYSYISFARSMNSSFVNGYIKGDFVAYVFEFDWDKMRSNNLFGKVNYFGDSGTEEEERLYTNKEYLPIDRYLTAVHICVNDDMKQTNVKYFKRIIDTLNKDIEKSTRRLAEYEKEIEELSKEADTTSNGDPSPGDAEKINSRRNYLIDNISILKINIGHMQRSIDDHEQSIEKIENAEFAVRDTVKKFSNNLGEIPVWLYHSPTAMRAVRWAEADQINPKAGNYTDGDANENL